MAKFLVRLGPHKSIDVDERSVDRFLERDRHGVQKL